MLELFLIWRSQFQSSWGGRWVSGDSHWLSVGRDFYGFSHVEVELIRSKHSLPAVPEPQPTSVSFTLRVVGC